MRAAFLHCDIIFIINVIQYEKNLKFKLQSKIVRLPSVQFVLQNLNYLKRFFQ